MAHQSQLVHRVSPNSITVILYGKVRTVQRAAPNFARLDEALKAGKVAGSYDTDLIADLVDISSFVARETHGLVTISENQVRYKGEKQEGLLVTRILQHLEAGYSVAPLAHFMEKLMQNPSKEVRSDLFAWLESGDMPIADDGDIVAFKKVQNDYYSYHSGKHGKVLHAMGTVVEIPRSDVDLNRYNECSNGLHFCSYGYLGNYMGGQGRVLMVKINPADVDAIPTDYGRQKGRTHRMFVYDEIAQSDAQSAYSGKLIAPKTGVVDTEQTARISGPEDNNLGTDGNGDVITIGRLRGLLAHGGVAYAATTLNVDESRIDALAEQIDFKRENLGDLTKKAQPIALPPADAPSPDVLNNAELSGFIAKFGGSIAHYNKAKEAVDAGKSAHAALFSDAATSDMVRNTPNVASFDAKVLDFFGKTPALKVSVKAKPAKSKKAKAKLSKGKVKAVVKAVKNAVAPTKTTAPAGIKFSRDGKDYSAQEVLDGVKDHGQRGFSAKTGVPRTTLQTWLAAIKQA